jgi:hypothetical protein
VAEVVARGGYWGWGLAGEISVSGDGGGREGDDDVGMWDLAGEIFASGVRLGWGISRVRFPRGGGGTARNNGGCRAMAHCGRIYCSLIE